MIAAESLVSMSAHNAPICEIEHKLYKSLSSLYLRVWRGSHTIKRHFGNLSRINYTGCSISEDNL